jgi:hypothetical protein
LPFGTLSDYTPAKIAPWSLEPGAQHVMREIALSGGAECTPVLNDLSGSQAGWNDYFKVSSNFESTNVYLDDLRLSKDGSGLVVHRCAPEADLFTC